MTFIDQEQPGAWGTPEASSASRGHRPLPRERRRRFSGQARLLAAIAILAATGGAIVARDRHGAHGSRTRSAERGQAAGRGSDDVNIYAATATSALSAAVANVPTRVYVPNSNSGTVDVIDPASFRVVRTLRVGTLPQHVTPSYDLKTLWVDNDHSNTLTAIDPRTGLATGTRPVTNPYNLYFSPGGHEAIVVAEARGRLDFRGASTMRLHQSVRVPCPGVDHLDFTADGGTILASCEFANKMIEVDAKRHRLLRSLLLPTGASPQDVKLSPDGRVFYVADKTRGGLYLIDAARFRVLGFLPTGADSHGLYLSRDTRDLYVTNRRAGTVSVVGFGARRVLRTWRIPGGSPDMGGVSRDGTILWLTGRYNAEVYAIDTRSGRLRARIRVGRGPHGLSIFPQPGRFSLGHTGVYR
ncbi:MAG: hypothetical protein ACR2KV_03925 [Solirubrobacteraceae bacterium]